MQIQVANIQYLELVWGDTLPIRNYSFIWTENLNIEYEFVELSAVETRKKLTP